MRITKKRDKEEPSSEVKREPQDKSSETSISKWVLMAGLNVTEK